MSTIGSAVDASAIQAAQAQQMASRTRDRERAAAESARRFKDVVDLRVAETETAEAVRPLPGSDTQQQRSEEDARRQLPPQPPQPDETRHVDLQA
jgi:hypothetical protein